MVARLSGRIPRGVRELKYYSTPPFARRLCRIPRGVRELKCFCWRRTG